MKTPRFFRRSRNAGYTLFMTLILAGAALVMVASTMSRLTTSAKLNDRQMYYSSGEYAAEAAVEKVVARMLVDFANGGPGLITNNVNYYRTNMLPSSAESSGWTNFMFSDAQGNSNATFVSCITTSANPPYIALTTQYPGLNGFAYTWRVLSNAKPLNGNNYNFTNAVQQDVQLAEIPVFQFAIFYNSLLEFTDTATLTVNGRVYANSNIYVGSPSAITFNSVVSATGNITNPAWFGMSQSSWTGTTTYNGKPAPGYDTGAPALTLPIGTNNTPAAVLAILYPPQTNDSVSMSQQRFYNKAGMIIMVSNNSVNVTIATGTNDPSPLVLTGTNWLAPANNISYFLTTNVFFGDQRENKTIYPTQIDVGKLVTWMATNSTVTTKFNSTFPLNIFYVADWRYTNGNNLSAVRLVNATNVPSLGFTLATPNPLYVWGHFNCPTAANVGTTNVSGTAACSFCCDALTLLSPAWVDSKSTNSSGGVSSYGTRNNGTSMTVNSALMAGVVYSTGSGTSQFSGGVQNYPRLLENWSSATLTLNTSLVNFYNSAWATNQFQSPGIYYNPPTRMFNFNPNYTSAGGLPPGTPQIDRLVRSSWCNPPPNNTAYVMPNTIDYVPH